MKRFPLLGLGVLVLAAGCDSDDGTINFDDTGPVDSEADTDTDTDADSDTDADTDSDTDTDNCAIGISYLDPGNNTTGVSVTPTLKAWFDSTATLDDVSANLSGPSGDVDGDLELIGGDMGLAFTPAELDRSTEYTFTVTTCTDEASSTFETVAGPIDTELVGNVYSIDLNSVTWNSPDSTTASLLLSQLEDDHILLEVTDHDEEGETITLLGAFGTSAGQDMCLEPIPFSEADFSGNPYYQVGPEDSEFEAAGISVPFYELTVSGSFNDDASAMESVSVTGYLDIRDVEYSGFAACDFVECVACPTDGVEGCAYLDVEDPEAPLESGWDLDETASETHPDC